MRPLAMMVFAIGCGYEAGPDLDIDGITDTERPADAAVMVRPPG
jgi:hypothetical protein